jgi:orotate phosphoribosyltransferase
MRADLSALLRERTGHFALESGHHGRRWLELETLFVRPAAVRPLADELAAKLAPYRPDVVCSPVIEGAFVGMFCAEALGIDFTYAVRTADPSSSDLFSVRYELPSALRAIVPGRRVAVVNDVINAGSAAQGAITDLIECGAEPIVLGALLCLGDSALNIARNTGMPLEALDMDSNEIWAPGRCPLCANGVPLTPHPGF